MMTVDFSDDEFDVNCTQRPRQDAGQTIDPVPLAIVSPSGEAISIVSFLFLFFLFKVYFNLLYSLIFYNWII